MEQNTINKSPTLTNTFLAIGMLLVACLIIPKYNAEYFTENVRCIALFSLASIFGLIQFSNKKTTVNFYTTDFAWWGLIAFTGVSAFWSVNEIYALYGLATTTLLYLCYKAFQTVEWTQKNGMYLLAALAFCVLINWGLEVQILKRYLFPFLFSEQRVERHIFSELNLNLNFLGSSLIILFPFLLFRSYKRSMLLDIIMLTIVLLVISYSGSAQVMLGAIFLVVFYLIYKSNISVKKILFLCIGASLILFISLLLIYFTRGHLRGLFFVIDEFFTQNDRFWMWEQSLHMLADAPLTGQGKNSWELLAGAYGFEGCSRCLRDPYKVNLFRHAHNAVFQIAGELGIPGILFYLGIGVLPLVELVRKKAKLSPLVLSAVLSLVLFFYVSLTYGVTYNFFNNFSGLTVLMAFNLALCGNFAAKDKIPKFTLSSNKFYSGYISFSILGLIFFSLFYSAENKLEKAAIFFKQKEYEQASEAYLNAYPFGDKFQIYKNLALINERMENTENAFFYYQKALDKNPYDVDVNFRYGNLIFSQGDTEFAQEVALFTSNVAPRFVPNEILLTKCYFKNGEKEKGISLRDALLKRLNQLLSQWERNKKKSRSKNIPKIKKDIKTLESFPPFSFTK